MLPATEFVLNLTPEIAIFSEYPETVAIVHLFRMILTAVARRIY